MNRILLVGSAHPKRVRLKAEQILAGREGALTILCLHDPITVSYFGKVEGATVIPLEPERRSAILRALRHERYDAIHLFWTGETRYRSLKLFALRLGLGRLTVDAGDGCTFQFTWKAILRFWQFRLGHRLPSDHYHFFPRPGATTASDQDERMREPKGMTGEKILVVQSAEPHQVLRALAHLEKHPMLTDPRFILFCRNRPEILAQFADHPMLSEVRTHSETRNSWSHFRGLRREHFDVVILFLTGDPSYWKIKCFALLLGARHRLVFNENNDCFFLTWRSWFSLLSHRLRERSRLPVQPHRHLQIRAFTLVLVKMLALPFRFAWLLAVWLRLRFGAWRASA